MNTNNNFKNMNINTIAFSKGYLFVKDYIKDDVYGYHESVYTNYLNDLTSIHPTVMAMQAELMRYGYMFDNKCLYYLDKMSDDTLLNLANDLTDYLADAYGDGCFVSLFGNFPQTVMSMSEIEMFFHQIVHYLSNGTYSPAMPSCDDAELKMLHDRFDGTVFRDSYKLITVIGKEEFISYFKKILSAQQSLTSYDKDVVSYVIDNYSELTDNPLNLIPEEVPFKETICILLTKLNTLYPNNVTDVLRYAVYLSGGDISLPAVPTKLNNGWSIPRNRMSSYLRNAFDNALKAARLPFKFKKFSRPERRRILGMIEYVLSNKSFDNVLEDMKKYSERWKRLGEILHPGEYSNKFPKTCEAFTTIRNADRYITTYYGRIDAARKSGDIKLLLEIYSERPGEFARNIDNLLRNYSSYSSDILEAFSKVTSKISIKMLYELLDYYNNRNSNDFRTNRYIFIKGSRFATKLPELSEINEEIIVKIINLLVNELKIRLAQTGVCDSKIYMVDTKLSNIALPKNMRNMNITPGQLSRGSILPIKTDTGIFRFYCRWTDKFGDCDLDLSAMTYDKDFNYVTGISWSTNYKQGVWAVYSGDVRHRKGNCAEYIDIDINGAKAAGVRYIVASVDDFDGKGFAKKDSWGGVMERSAMSTEGELTWAPKTITTGFKLTSACSSITMSIIDLEKMIMYVIDEDDSGIPVAATRTEEQVRIIKRYVNMNRYFNAQSLIKFSIESRNGKCIDIDHDEIDDYKNRLNEFRERLIDLKDKYSQEISVLVKADNMKDAEDLNRLYGNIVKMIDDIDNTSIISYDDIASDYTKLFEWMF